MKSKIDYEEILKLIDLLEERNLSAFELEIESRCSLILPMASAQSDLHRACRNFPQPHHLPSHGLPLEIFRT